VIDSVDGYATTIASAVEEQTVTTSEIGRNITEAATASPRSPATQTQNAAHNLTDLATSLRQRVATFRLSQNSDRGCPDRQLSDRVVDAVGGLAQPSRPGHHRPTNPCGTRARSSSPPVSDRMNMSPARLGVDQAALR
jgi:hypothetical protein